MTAPGAPRHRSTFLFGLVAGAGALVSFLGLVGLREIPTVLMMLIAAFFVAVGLDRPVAALVRRGMRRGAAVGLVVATGLLLFCGGLGLAVPLLAAQTSAFFEAIPGYIDEVMSGGVLARLNAETDLADRLADLLTPGNIAAVASGLLSGAASILGALGIAATVGILSLFMLATLGKLRAGAYRFVVASRRERVAKLGDAALENWVVYPRMMSRAVKISNLAAIVAALLGGALFGVLGVLIAVPVYASLQMVVREGVFPRQDAR